MCVGEEEVCPGWFVLFLSQRCGALPRSLGAADPAQFTTAHRCSGHLAMPLRNERS